MRNKRLAFVALLMVGLAFIAVGAAMAQPDSVWVQAAKICLECIGIG